MILVTGLGWFVLEVIDVIDGDGGTDGITDCSTNGVGVGFWFGVSIFNDAIDDETDDGCGSVDGTALACVAFNVSFVSILSADCCVETKCIIKFSFPFTLLKIAFFSSGKSILLRELGSFSFDIIIRLLSNGKLTRPTKSFLVFLY